ncbi:MAG: class F sortase [Candidatus Saccharimonadales bacterium]
MALNNKNRRRVSWALLAASLIMIVGGALMLMNSSHDDSQPPAQAQAQAGAPDAKKPSKVEIDNYIVAADTPRYIYIPEIKVPQTRIKHLGIDKQGQIAVPDNLYDTGWYIDSAKPGQAGAMFIYGHISSWQANGIFYDLNKLQSGDIVTVERGDGRKFNYKVVKTKIYPADKVNMSEVLTAAEPDKPGLSLMTCAGKVKPGTSEFTERLVVFASLVAS